MWLSVKLDPFVSACAGILTLRARVALQVSCHCVVKFEVFQGVIVAGGSMLRRVLLVTWLASITLKVGLRQQLMSKLESGAKFALINSLFLSTVSTTWWVKIQRASGLVWPDLTAKAKLWAIPFHFQS